MVIVVCSMQTRAKAMTARVMAMRMAGAAAVAAMVAKKLDECE